MPLLQTLRVKILGPARDPMSPDTRRHIALIAFFAWVGLGADGLSSSCYGPEEAFLALGQHTHLALYLAIATAITVFIISFAYNQVIELFPSGGGGYKVATKLIGPYAGLVSGAALIVDYVLTIAISVASGADALFSLLPVSAQPFKLATGLGFVLLLVILNLRGMKESIKFLLPIFVGFVLTHLVLIVYGIFFHSARLPTLLHDTTQETFNLSSQLGWAFVISHLLLAYSTGGGTYTGLEAVSNNVNTLAEPRARTGKWTMFYLAVSLAFTASGIIMLYLLWDVHHVPGQTLNAVVFNDILKSWTLGGIDWSGIGLPVVLALEAGLLFVAANTGFLGGPAVLANMAADRWVPHQFSYLSSRLVTRNGVMLMALAAIGILLWSHGSVTLLVVLYGVNVFLTFSLSLAGMSIYWWRNRGVEQHWVWHLALSGVGLTVTAGILVVLIVEKFGQGGWVTVLITSMVIAACLLVRRHYDETRSQLKQIDTLFAGQQASAVANPPALDHSLPTAVLLVGKSRGSGMHTLLWVQRLFPEHFKNFIFVSVGEVDSQSYGGSGALEHLRDEVGDNLQYFINFCHHNGLAAEARLAYGSDVALELTKLAETIHGEYANCVFFASKLIFVHDNWGTRLLHNQTADVLQRRLHLQGMQMVILPMKV
ncbi:MAG: APC family permease [Pseudomonadota bacterium]|jgi:amino acid transporter